MPPESQIVAHPDRLLHPLQRTAPKGAADPGWERIGWDEALATIAARLTAIAAESGPEAVVFGNASPSTSAMSDSVDWLMRLRHVGTHEPIIPPHHRFVISGAWQAQSRPGQCSSQHQVTVRYR